MGEEAQVAGRRSTLATRELTHRSLPNQTRGKERYAREARRIERFPLGGDRAGTPLGESLESLDRLPGGSLGLLSRNPFVHFA